MFLLLFLFNFLNADKIKEKEHITLWPFHLGLTEDIYIALEKR